MSKEIKDAHNQKNFFKKKTRRTDTLVNWEGTLFPSISLLLKKIEYTHHILDGNTHDVRHVALSD
jgi:hypothetical protein